MKMKNILTLTALTFVSTSVFANTLTSDSIYGGGDFETGNYFEVTSVNTNTTINANATSGTQYAGITGSQLSYVFTNTPSNESITAYNGSSNFYIKNSIYVSLDPAEWQRNNYLYFDVKNNSTLKLNTFEIVRTKVDGYADGPIQSYIVFRGETGGSSKVIYNGTDGSGANDAAKGYNNLNAMLDLQKITFTNENVLWIKGLKMETGSALSLGADMTTETHYMNDNHSINLNGYNYKSTSGLNVEGSSATKVIDVTFGTEADDTSVFAIKGNAVDWVEAYVTRYNLVEYAFTDYDPTTDFIYFKDIPTNENVLSITGGLYAGQTFLTKAGEGEWAGWTQYYVEAIPEPAEYAAVFALLALGFAIYRRK